MPHRDRDSQTPALVTRLSAFCDCRVQFRHFGSDFVGLKTKLGAWELYRLEDGLEQFLGYAGDGTRAELDRLHGQAPFADRLGRFVPAIIGSNLGRVPVVVQAALLDPSLRDMR